MGRPRTELFDAAKAGDLAGLRRLLSEPDGSDFENKARARDASDALSMAARYGEIEMVEALIKAGAPLNDTHRGQCVLTEILGSHRCDDRAWRALLAAGADPSQAGDGGATPLGAAARMGNEAAVRELLAAGAVVDCPSESGHTALVLALGAKSDAIAMALLEAGANPETTWREGQTPLMSAAERGRAGLVAALVKAGASLEARDPGGLRALHWAARGSSVACAEELLRAGADFDAKTFKGKSVLDCAGYPYPDEEEQTESFRQWAQAAMASRAERAEIREALGSAVDPRPSARRPGP